MRKLKLLMAVCTLLLGAGQTWAQTDYTSSVGTAQANWTGASGAATVGGISVVELYNSSSAGTKMSQEVSGLPTGTYDVVLYATSHNARYEDGADLRGLASDHAYVFATSGGVTNKTYFNAHGVEPNALTGEPYECTISNIPVTDGKITLGLGLEKARQTGWHTIQIKSLTQTGTLADGYADVKATATTLASTSEKVSATVLGKLTTAISTYGSVDTSDDDATKTAIDALKAATEAVNKSIAEYDVIESGVIATNVISCWTTTNTNSFHVNTWSNEGATDGTNMGTPFIENWLSSGGKLGEGKLYYKFEGLEPGEKYAVSARIRVLREDGGTLSDVTFYVNDQEKAFLANSTACTNGKYGVLSLTGEVDSKGVLEIGINIPADCDNNWISFKDVTIQESTGQLVTGITLSESSLALKYSETSTLTATVAPDNADDKTYSWSSSDETVATVSAAGVVTAVGIGSATITCTANDGSEVSASCSVTVTDVAAVAAPANVSEVAAGKFLIINAATGKALGGANSYGTQASLIEHAAFATLVADGDNFKITNICASTNGLGSNGYVDNGTPVALTFTKKSNGAYTMVQDGKYVTAQYNNTVVSMSGTYGETTLAQWYLINETDANKNLVTATTENPVDVTYYIGDPNFSRNVPSTAWTMEANNKNLAGGADYNQCAESWLSSNGFNLSQVLTVPNGTYKLRAQAGASVNASNVFVFANDKTTAFNTKGSEGSMTSMSESFTNGLYYTDWIEVTVTDHKLTVGAKTTETGSWCLWDNFELEMTEYLPVTALAATFDVDDDDETEGIQIEEGKTGNISVTMTPTPASFDALTYTSSDETVATVTDAGVVTAVAAGTATITIAAEMENVTTTLAINVVEPAVVPATIALTVNDEEVDEILLDGSDLTATLTATVGPDGAPQAVTWTSSDETVATVADGIITGISTGTATITATSSVNGEVSASVTVNVFMFANGSFENSAAGTALTNVQKSTTGSALTMYGWTETVPGTQWNDTQIYNSSTANSSAFGTKVNPTNGNYYLFFRQSWNGSSTNDMTLTTGTMTLPIGKYTISYDYMLAESTDGSHTSSGTTLTLSALDSESATLNSATVSAALNPGSSYFTTDANWASSSFVLTLTEETTVSFKLAMTPRGGVRSDMCVDNFAISYENIKEALPSMIADVTIPTANVGTGAFQISSTAVATLSDAVDDAQAVYDNAETTDAQAIAAIEALEDAVEAFDATPLNAPTAGKTYNIINNSTGYNYAGNAVTFKSASDADLTGNTTSMGYNEAPGSIYPQGVTFTAVDGVLNGYKLSYTRADGNTVYVGTGASVGYVNNGNNNQIRPTTDPLKSVTIQVVATTTEGVWNLYNTLASQNIGANGANDQGFFTVGNYNSMTLQEATNNEVALNITAANQYGSLILPFNAEIPTGVTAYSVSEAEGNTLTLVEKDAFEANTPYIVFAEEGISTTLAGLGAAYTDATYTDGLLTGTYTQIAAPNESYILQNQDGKVGFYQVNTEVATPNVPANRAYLTAPANARPAAFFFDSEATGINAINALSNGEAEIYDVNGMKLQKLQKGMNIIRSNGKTYKVVVK